MAASSQNSAQRKIKAIDVSSVHRICSGQVILDPSSALKELIENSIDAGATRLDVRLKEFGLEILEVCDNGHGIKPEDYEMLAMKHTTSKLSQFEDITSLTSFGFRGEALSSLCAISESFTIITRTKDQMVGTKLVYDKNGTLKSTSNTARDGPGTTITLEGIFKALPVRYKDFTKNKTREYQRLLRRLQVPFRKRVFE
jgi:DNA mismatch repair protein PMS2